MGEMTKFFEQLDTQEPKWRWMMFMPLRGCHGSGDEVAAGGSADRSPVSDRTRLLNDFPPRKEAGLELWDQSG